MCRVNVELEIQFNKGTRWSLLAHTNSIPHLCFSLLSIPCNKSNFCCSNTSGKCFTGPCVRRSPRRRFDPFIRKHRRTNIFKEIVIITRSFRNCLSISYFILIASLIVLTLLTKNPKWWKIFVENIYTWYSSREKFLLLDFSGMIVESIWTTSLIVGRESGSNNKHSFAKYAIICISSVWNFPSSCGSGSSRITRLLSSNRGVACN